jgi:hypothetical protein
VPLPPAPTSDAGGLIEGSHGQLLYELPHPRLDGSTHTLRSFGGGGLVLRTTGPPPSYQRIELGDARSKPGPAHRLTDEEDGAVAVGRWRRDEHIVDPEVAVGRQRDTGRVSAVLDEGCHGFTNQRREDAGVAVLANAVAAAQQQASAVDVDTPVDLHIRPESGDHPDLAGRVDEADNVPGYIREGAVGVDGPRHV